MKTLKIGMVGAGWITGWHLQGFSTLANVEFVGMCQDFRGSTEQIAAKKEQFKQRCDDLKLKAFDSFDAMLADPALDAVIVASINPCHYNQIIAALNAGKHVLAEKPVVTDFEQLSQIEKLCEQTGRVVFPAHNFAYRGAVQQARAIIESGKLGRIVSSSFVATHAISDAHARGWRSKKALAAGGALMDSGHHLVYQILYLLGMPQTVQAFVSKIVQKEMECEDTAQMSMQFADGSVCHLMQSWASNHGNGISGIHIIGENGNLIISDALYFNGEKLGTDVEYSDSFANQAKAFADCIMEGKPPVSTLRDVRDTLRLIFGAYESAEKHTVVQL